MNKDSILSGIISVNSRGIGYFRPDFAVKTKNKDQDIEIQNENLNTALHGDEVLISVLSRKINNRINGKVIKIKKRQKLNFVGTIEQENGKLFFNPDDRRVYAEINLPINSLKEIKAKAGDKVLVKIFKWEKNKNPEGKIIKKLGKAGEHNTEMESILYERGFEIGFPDQVEAEAHHLEKTEKPIPQTEITKRRDFRQTPTFTIDPKDAKDFDDAISFKRLTNGNYEIGVHIADVSHYVREKSALDAEAVKREFSVYLVDRTIPMLPEVLSNDICSLNPNEEKLTFSAVFEMNAEAKVLNRWFGKTIIKSFKRFTYESAQEVLTNKTGEYFTELETLNNLAKKLRQDKTLNGAIDFEHDEIGFELDNNGKPVRIYKKERLDTHKLVEEYMLLANKEVAEFIFKAHKKQNIISPFLYRIHDLPNSEKIGALAIFVKALGYNLEPDKKKGITAKDLQNLFKQIEGRPEESMIKTAAVRSMAKAIYSTQNIGHFGLAFEFYTHFTSPIRRYPDLLVHRLLEKQLKGEKVSKQDFVKYDKICQLATDQEIKAAEAERDSKKYKQVEYMTNHIGEIFDGTITGITDWGVYIEEKDTKAEGMVKIRDLGNDYFVLDEKNYCLVGEKTKQKFSLGDQVKFKITSADLDKKAIDCVLIDKN